MTESTAAPPNPLFKSFLFKGFLMKRGNVMRTWKKRFFVLHDDGKLKYYENSDATHPIGEIDVDQIRACRFSEKNTSGLGGFAFELVTRRRTFQLIADTEEHMQLWTQAIGNAKIMRDDPDNRVAIEAGSNETAGSLQAALKALNESAEDEEDPKWENGWINDDFDSDDEGTDVSVDEAVKEAVEATEPKLSESVDPVIEPASAFIESDLPEVPTATLSPAKPTATSPSLSSPSATVFFKQYHKRRPEWQSFHQMSEQLRAFAAWTNFWLAAASSNRRVDDLAKDLCNGDVVSDLLRFFMAREGVVLDEHLNCELQADGNDDHMVLVLRRFFKAFRQLPQVSRAYMPPTINAVAVASGNVKVILDCLWALAVTFNVANGGVDTLLQWHAASVPSVPLPPSSQEAPLGVGALFDGTRLVALVQTHWPLVDTSSLSAFNPVENLRLAFALATKHLGVPAFLDAEDVTSNAFDEASAILYLALLKTAIEQL